MGNVLASDIMKSSQATRAERAPVLPVKLPGAVLNYRDVDRLKKAEKSSQDMIQAAVIIQTMRATHEVNEARMERDEAISSLKGTIYFLKSQLQDRDSVIAKLQYRDSVIAKELETAKEKLSHFQTLSSEGEAAKLRRELHQVRQKFARMTQTTDEITKQQRSVIARQHAEIHNLNKSMAVLREAVLQPR